MNPRDNMILRQAYHGNYLSPKEKERLKELIAIIKRALK